VGGPVGCIQGSTHDNGEFASITLRSWQVGTNGPPSKRDPSARSQTSKDNEPIYLPTNLDRVWKKAQKKGETNLENLSFELDVSSIVISTNTFGDFSKSTIVSKLLNEKPYGILLKRRGSCGRSSSTNFR